MQTYLMDAIVRWEDPKDGRQGPEGIIECTNIRADSEIEARRQVLGMAWSRGYLVSALCNVRTQISKPK
jgi:hypothetical protein